MKNFYRRMNFFILVSAIAAITLLSTAVCAQSLKVDKSKWPKRLAIGAGPMGSHGYMVGSIWAGVLGKELGLNISVEITGGAVHNTKLTDAGTCDIGYSYMGIASNGWDGTAKWAENKKLREYRGFLVGFPAVIHFYSLKRAGLTNLKDFNGKVVSLNQLGNGSNLWGNRILTELKIKPSRIATVSPSDSNNLLRDGTISAALCMGSTPHSAVSELGATHEIDILSFTPEQQEAILKPYGKIIRPYEIPPGTYKGLDKPVATLSEYDIWITSQKLPDDLVYMMLKTTFDKKEDLIKGLVRFNLIVPELAKNSSIPLSQGAYQFYREKGVSLPAEIQPVK